MVDSSIHLSFQSETAVILSNAAEEKAIVHDHHT